MRKLGISIGIIVAAVIAAIAIFAATFNVNRYRGTIQAELTKALGRNASLGEMHLRIFPPRFQVRDVSIADDPAFQSNRPFVQVQQLDLSIKLSPLLHKSFEIDSLYLQRPAIELIKNRQGVWNFASLGPSTGAAGAPRPATQESSSGKLSLSKLVIQDGQISATDQQAGQSRSTYDHIDVTLRDFAAGRPFSIDAAAHLPGPDDQQIKLSGQGGPIRQDQPASTPFHGTLDLERVQIAGARQFLSSPALAKMDGRLSGQTNISSEGGKLSAEGNLSVQNARMNGRDLGYPIALQYKVRDDVPADLLSIDNANIRLGATPISIHGTVNSKSAPAQIDLFVKANGVSIVEAAKLAANAGVALTPGANVVGTVDANLEARGAVDNPALNGTINARDLQVSGKDVPQPVQVSSAVLSLTPSAIRSNTFTVNSGGTSVAVQFTLQQYLSKNPTVDATLRAANAELPALLSMAKAYGITALNNVSGAGTLNLDLHAAGPVQSAASADLTRALNGTLDLNFHDVRYSGADISHELTGIAGALGLHPANQGSTNIQKMTGNIVVKQGIAQTNNLQALLDIGNLGIAGSANLVDQALNLRVTVVMSKELSQKAGGTNITGYAKTALANPDGELVIPAMVTGTFQHPRFTPDLQQLAQMRLKGLMPNSKNPAAAVSGILGNLLNRQSGNPAQPQSPAASPNPSASPSPLQQLKDIFGKKKEQQPPQK